MLWFRNGGTMGVWIYLRISKAVTEEEWREAYEGAVHLAEHLPFSKIREKKIRGYDVLCLTKPEEAEYRFGGYGWAADGDYETLLSGETFFLPRYLVRQENPDAGDAVLHKACDFLNCHGAYPFWGKTYGVWGEKSCGEPYHRYLLAVAAYISAKLGSKAYVYGDVTVGEFKEAVRKANQFLDEPIAVPDECDMKRWYERTSRLPLPEEERLGMFVCGYLGDLDDSFKNFVRRHVSEECLQKWWKRTVDDGSGEAPRTKEDLINALFSDAWQKSCHSDDMDDSEDEQIPEYDITCTEDLIFYENEETIEPELEESLPYSLQRLHSFFSTDEFEALMKRSAKDRCQWLADHSDHLEIRDKDWERIIRNVRKNPDAFRRYYSAFAGDLYLYDLDAFARAYVINDDFYQYCMELFKCQSTKEEE